MYADVLSAFTSGDTKYYLATKNQEESRLDSGESCYFLTDVCSQLLNSLKAPQATKPK